MPPTTHRASPIRLRPLHLWHLLSLDAPTVAALWTSFIAASLHLRLTFITPLSMFLAVWLLYAADRLLDATRPLDPLELEPRHHFHHRHRTAFLAGIGLSSISLAVLLPLIPPEALRLYLILGALLAAYFILIHALAAAPRLPKELAVGLFFAAATFIPTVARNPELRLPLLPPALLLAALCSLNCLFIYAWEHGPGTRTEHPPHAATRIALRRLPRLAAFTLLFGIALLLFDKTSPRPLAAAATLSTAALLLLHARRHRISRLTLRTAADLILLTPLFFLPLHR